jgi:hypothetical protein
LPNTNWRIELREKALGANEDCWPLVSKRKESMLRWLSIIILLYRSLPEESFRSMKDLAETWI